MLATGLGITLAGLTVAVGLALGGPCSLTFTIERKSLSDNSFGLGSAVGWTFLLTLKGVLVATLDFAGRTKKVAATAKHPANPNRPQAIVSLRICRMLNLVLN